VANEAIPLAKHFDITKLEFPVMLSEKLDGVPVRFVIHCGPTGLVTAKAISRQHEILRACEKDLMDFVGMNIGLFTSDPGRTWNFVFEVTHRRYTTFKDISGVVRRNEPQMDLVYNLFDADTSYDAGGISLNVLGTRLIRGASIVDRSRLVKFNVVQQIKYETPEDLQDALDNTVMSSDQEGWIIRSMDALFKPGTRHWDYQKIVKDQTIDLWITGAVEGVGKFAGGVGKFIAQYKGKEIGIGPGKQTTAERKLALAGKYPRMACIKYKPDESYAALRQPTFQHWRDDKSEADA